MGAIAMPQWLKPIISFFMVLAGCGLVLSFLSHIAALFGFNGPLGRLTWLLHPGIFVVGIPAVLVSQRLTSEFKRKDYWKAALRGCPTWMRYLVNGLIGYLILNFVYFVVTAPKQGGSGGMPPAVVRGFSGHWMFFYAMSMAMLYSATHVEDRDGGRRCVNGHPMGPIAEFCERCGQRLDGRPVE